MSDWDALVAARPRLLRPGVDVEVGEPRAWDRGGLEGLPVLSGLLARSTVTPVELGGSARLELVGFDGPDGRRGWLSVPPLAETLDAPVAPVHRPLWSIWGGIAETWGEPEHLDDAGFDTTWWGGNHREILTPGSAASDAFVRSMDAYAWIWEDSDLEVPIAPGDFYVVAEEANGNLTVAHRESGQVLLFGPDHAYVGVSVLEGCPPQSLYTYDAAPDLASWIELCAGQWA